MAVVLILCLGTAMAFGTRHEALYGTPAAQHYFYKAAWFQVLLFFLVINLIVSAQRRFPWKKKHVGFVMTHVGIVTLLVGNLIGIWFGIEGTLTIPEAESRDQLELSRDQLFVQPLNPGEPHLFSLPFNLKPWVHDVNQTVSINLKGEPLQVTIDRYLPNATVETKVVPGIEEFPAVRLSISAFGQDPQEVWLFSRIPERFGVRLQETNILFFEVESEKELSFLVDSNQPPQTPAKGILRLAFPERKLVREIDVASTLGKRFPIEGTPYTLFLRDYFADFALTEEGPTSQSDEPLNPALSFTLEGPEGKEPFIVFALYPEFETMHGVQRAIPVEARYEVQAATPQLPPNLIGIVRSPEAWHVVMTSPDGEEKEIIPFTLNKTYEHPWEKVSMQILERLPAARISQEFRLKDNEVKRPAIHAIVEKGGLREEFWMAYGEVKQLLLGEEGFVIGYQRTQRPLPFSVTLKDFRKKEYPGTTVPSAFESDLEIRDDSRGLRLSKTISMNNPLTYRGYTMFQASFAMEPVETTVLAVRKDPGTPIVYTGFITIVLGMVLMFYFRTGNPKRSRRGR